MSNLVNSLGVIAGGLWMVAALHFQFIHDGVVHPGIVSGMFLIGVALFLGSASIAAPAGTALLLAILGQLLFIVLGIATALAVERYAVEDHDINDAVDELIP